MAEGLQQETALYHRAGRAQPDGRGLQGRRSDTATITTECFKSCRSLTKVGLKTIMSNSFFYFVSPNV